MQIHCGRLQYKNARNPISEAEAQSDRAMLQTSKSLRQGGLRGSRSSNIYNINQHLRHGSDASPSMASAIRRKSNVGLTIAAAGRRGALLVAHNSHAASAPAGPHAAQVWYRLVYITSQIRSNPKLLLAMHDVDSALSRSCVTRRCARRCHSRRSSAPTAGRSPSECSVLALSSGCAPSPSTPQLTASSPTATRPTRHTRWGHPGVVHFEAVYSRIWCFHRGCLIRPIGSPSTAAPLSPAPACDPPLRLAPRTCSLSPATSTWTPSSVLQRTRALMLSTLGETGIAAIH